ncbi:MAG: alpha-D-ribose 1-methylphosphonate 5-triphosphate diphosphatase [Pseudomonadota bacterium]
MRILIEGGRVLSCSGLETRDLVIEDGHLSDGPAGAAERIDARGLHVLPGIIDLHGDAFERQIMPRPGVAFPLDVALIETDRQLLANGITTAYHGVSVSWEPGLRSAAAAQAFFAALTALRPRLGCDNRVHIRWETFALDAVEDVIRWIGADPAPIVAFNDHTTGSILKSRRVDKIVQMAERAGLSLEAYRALQESVWARRGEVPGAIEAVAAAARARGAILLAHDEPSPEERVRFRALGAVTSEFPETPETAQAAREAGEHTILGAPNVLRGGSHCGMMDAAPAVGQGLCTVLASDYYYPAPLHAAFKLAREGVVGLEAAWRLISTNAADAAQLSDRGRIAAGQRADLVLVAAEENAPPRVVATYVAGRRAFSAL